MRGSAAEQARLITQLTPMRHLGQPPEVVEVVAFLASTPCITQQQ
ncbi:MAG: hypothetical protein ABWK05_06565 [Pyrobaculum sp.]